MALLSGDNLKFHLTLKSTNKKTGLIPVSTSSAETCPKTCPFRGSQGCYAAHGPLAIHWREVTNETRGDSYSDFLGKIARLPREQIWRHNQAGDLAPIEDWHSVIDAIKLRNLVEASAHTQGFTYTHHLVEGEELSARVNRAVISISNKKGMTINLSANSLEHADKLAELDIAPVCTLLPSDTTVHSLKTPKGRRVTVCPATYDTWPYAPMQCDNCRLCALPKRKTIVGFPAHGTTKKAIDTYLRQVTHAD